MKALKITGIILLILVVLFLVVAFFLPSKVYIEESIVINKPASVIFKQVNNFKNWPAWSPWQANDPEQVNTYEGPEQGMDAKTTWTSKKNGNGSMIIIESVPYTKVSSSLDIGMAGATNVFLLKEEQGATKVTWGVNLPKLAYPMERYIGLMMPGMMKMNTGRSFRKAAKMLPRRASRSSTAVSVRWTMYWSVHQYHRPIIGAQKSMPSHG